MDHYPIQTFWAGPISDMELLCLKSWVGHGHPVHLYTYDDISGLPVGVIRMDAREIVPEDEVFLYDGPMPKTVTADAFAYMPFADKFRYRLLRFNGGLWLDLDIILIRPIPDELFELDFWCSSERTLQAGAYKSTDPYKPNIGAIYCKEPESDLMVELTNIRKPVRGAWDGLKSFQKWLRRLDLTKGVLQPSVFCDMAWMNVKDITVTVSDTEHLPPKWGVPGCSVIPPPEAIGVHCWRGLLRKNGIKYGKLDVSPLSYLGRLYRHAEDVYAAKLESMGM
jgi:hypothetical protein